MLSKTLSVMANEVENLYIKYRTAGNGRNAAIECVYADYSHEMQDDDDSLPVLIGVCLALCRKNELIESVAEETLGKIQAVCQTSEMDNATRNYLTEVMQRLQDRSVYGGEARYSKRVAYVPDWKKGDAFAHMLTHPDAEKLGIKGWYIVLCKVGEHIDAFGERIQLMCVSVCPPDKLPSHNDEFQELGFLRMMRRDGGWEYLAQIRINSRKDELAYSLTKLGCFPIVRFPGDQCDEDPLTAMPLFGKLRRNDQWPGYEDQICRLYRRNGLTKQEE